MWHRIMDLFMGKKFKRGEIEAFDLSPKSIQYAESHLKRKNIKFTSADIFDFEPKNSVFDCLLLFDVLEHIPPEKHIQLFRKISKWMDSSSILLINLPNPNHILFDKKNNPENLQDIDHPVFS
jgi:2-polyprenyl-3-methyl-5-hydroxy-6-metoxy-1,4-benzoquinol methylase